MEKNYFGCCWLSRVCRSSKLHDSFPFPLKIRQMTQQKVLKMSPVFLLQIFARKTSKVRRSIRENSKLWINNSLLCLIFCRLCFLQLLFAFFSNEKCKMTGVICFRRSGILPLLKRIWFFFLFWFSPFTASPKSLKLRSSSIVSSLGKRSLRDKCYLIG